jgi:peptidoglycan hydrolase-like protein with peptidoglycan-binding domain
MRDARLYPRRGQLRAMVALGLLTALLCGILADDARAATAGTARGAPATGVVAAPVTAAAPAAALVAAPAATPTLRLGSKGAAVLRLQRRLATLGYDVGKANSVFGNDTLHGVRAFQKVQRLAINGVVNKATWTRLASPVVPRARYSGSAAAVEVDLTKRVLYLTRGGAVTAIFDISPGKPSTPTVTGRFAIYRRVNRWDYGPLGGLYRPNYFYHGFALHGSLSVPTYAASHGCVRLTTAAMDRLWRRLTIGEKVSVYRR